MSASLPVLFVWFLSCLLLLSSSFAYGDRMIDHWCDETPNPGPCKHMLTHKPRGSIPRSKSQWRKTAVKLALESAIKAQGHNKWLGSQCRSTAERAAWFDCLQLYQDIIENLNRTLYPKGESSGHDAQTWLSAALTDFETCRAGFVELGVPGHIPPLMSHNVSKLISNTLAVNNDTFPSVKTVYDGSGFPSWVKPGDRKLLQSSDPSPDVVVAQDGSGDFRTIKEALDAAASMSGSERFVIRVRRGVYSENLEIESSMKNIMLVGDSMRYTIITGNRSVRGGSTTFRSATVAVSGSGFIAKGINFRNTAGPENHQAVAMRSSADFSVFYRCGFEGYQDTLYVHSKRQFYKECYVYGTIDFIFGNAAAVLQNCIIVPRRPMDGQKNAITAQGRTDPNQNTGISIQDSYLMPSSDLKPVVESVKTYLGRPWKEYSRTVFMHTYMVDFIEPKGWLEWDGDFALNTLYYGEYRNLGPGAKTSGRVDWKGFRVITNATEASMFTVERLIAGQSWLPNAGVPFKSGL